MKYPCLPLFLCILLLLGGCGSAVEQGNAILTAAAADNVRPENPHGLTASFQDGNIAVSDENSGDMLSEIPLSEDEYTLFLSMTDDNHGCLLYCSSPAAGIMMKHLYITEDRWATYEEKDLSSLIDGYPTSLSALSTDHIYIGTQMPRQHGKRSAALCRKISANRRHTTSPTAFCTLRIRRVRSIGCIFHNPAITAATFSKERGLSFV